MKMKKTMKALALSLALLNLTGCTSIYKIVKGRAPVNPVVKTDVEYVKSFNEQDMGSTNEYLNKIAAKNSTRVPSTTGEKRAVDFAKKSMESFGFNVSLKEFPVSYSIKDTISLTSTDESRYYESYLNSNSSDEFMDGNYEIKDLDSALLEDIESEEVDLKGKIALIKIGFVDINKTIKIYEQKGCVAVVAYSVTTDEIIQGSLKEKSKIPVLSISKEDGLYLSSKISQSEKASKIKLTKSEVKVSGESMNLIASYGEIDPALKTVVLTAHTDGLGKTAANDNASGVAALLRVAEYVGSNPPADVNVVFCFMGASTANGAGAKELMDYLNETKIKDKSSIINLDTIGAGDSIRIRSSKKDSTLAGYISNLSENMGFEVKKENDNFTDEGNIFTQEGVENITLTAFFKDKTKEDELMNSQDVYSMIKPEMMFKIIDITINALLQAVK